MKKLLTIFLVSSLLCGCYESRKFTVVGDLKLSKTITVDNSGEFSDTWTIQPSDVKGELDIPEDATVDEVNIEYISANAVVLNGNEAEAVGITGVMSIDLNKPMLFDYFTVPLVSETGEFVKITSLSGTGVQSIKSKLEEFLKLGTGNPFDLDVTGSSSPVAGKRVHSNINIIITGSVTYHRCFDVPFILGEEKCTQ